MYEIINTFNQPYGSDKSYARLMCWGLFFGQTVEGEALLPMVIPFDISLSLAGILLMVRNIISAAANHTYIL